MKKKIIAGNWKMNHTYSEATSLLNEISNINYQTNRIEIIIAPPYPYLEIAKNINQNTQIKIAAQDCSEHSHGAYTGEVSAKMIKSLGAEYVIIGHSERRMYHNENNQQLLKKVHEALNNKLKVIFCIGETLEERQKNIQYTIIEQQLNDTLLSLSNEIVEQIFIAYEPVWAIGTGITASSLQAQEMHQYIRSLFCKKVGNDAANQMNILYGGSCNASNAKELFACKDIDGGLIGGASLKSADFANIIASV